MSNSAGNASVSATPIRSSRWPRRCSAPWVATVSMRVRRSTRMSIERLVAYVSRQRDPRAEILRFPPVMSRDQLEKSGYLKSFPNLLGCVCALHGSEAAIRSAADSHYSGGDWTQALTAADLVLSPRGVLPGVSVGRRPRAFARGWVVVRRGGGLFPPRAVALARSSAVVPMREFVRIGTPQDVMSFREQWMARRKAWRATWRCRARWMWRTIPSSARWARSWP